MTLIEWLEESRNDFGALAVSITLLLGYQWYLRFKLRHDPRYTFQSVNRVARMEWVKGILSDPARTIIGVQTLRNSTMASTFFASTAVLLMMGTLTLTGQSAQLSSPWHQLNVLGSSHPGIWITKVLFLLSTFMVAFFSFAMAVRLFHHVGYFLGLPEDRRPEGVTPGTVGLHLNRAGHYYGIGMRAYYLAVPVVFWLFGPHLMVAATVVLIAVLYHVDRNPRMT